MKYRKQTEEFKNYLINLIKGKPYDVSEEFSKTDDPYTLPNVDWPSSQFDDDGLYCLIKLTDDHMLYGISWANQDSKLFELELIDIETLAQIADLQLTENDKTNV